MIAHDETMEYGVTADPVPFTAQELAESKREFYRRKELAAHHELAELRLAAKTPDGRAFHKRWRNFLRVLVCRDERHERGSAGDNQQERDIAFSILGREPSAEELRIVPKAYRAMGRIAQSGWTYGGDFEMDDDLLKMKLALESGLSLDEVRSIKTYAFDRLRFLA
jgi:hypothetical protein